MSLLTSMNVAELCGLRWRYVNLTDQFALLDGEAIPPFRAAVRSNFFRQEVDRQDINLRGKVNDQVELLKQAFTFEELNAMQARMQAVIDAEQGKSAPPANIIDGKPILEAADGHEKTTAPDAASGEGKRPSWATAAVCRP